MFQRKIGGIIESHLANPQNPVLVVDGARQVGKSYIVRKIGSQMFPNYIELNLLEDSVGDRLFAGVSTVDDFHIRLSAIAGERLGSRDDTLVFLDEIQEYPQLLTLLKFLNQEARYTYVASGSLLGVTLAKTSSIPMGGIAVHHMFPMDFEEFLWANGVGAGAIEAMRKAYFSREALDEALHGKILGLFRKYLLVGGLPDAVKAYVNLRNIAEVRRVQRETKSYYATDASKYDREHKLKINRIYEDLPSNLMNKKKRVVVSKIEGKRSARFSHYADEFDYLLSSGIALGVKAVSAPSFPLVQLSGKNLLKLYLNDVGILTSVLYGNNVSAVLDDEASVNLGSVYESAVAQELAAHGMPLFYYDNRTKGEVDFLIDDYAELSVVPIEVKSGKDYAIHSARNAFLANPDYGVKKGVVLSNSREVRKTGMVEYLPVYYAMFIGEDTGASGDATF